MNGKCGNWQFSLRELFGVMTFVAVGCVALVNASGWWLMGLSSVLLGLTMAAAVVAVFGCGTRRAFAGGFLICSLAYMFFVSMAVEDDSLRMPYAVTTWLLNQFYHLIAAEALEPYFLLFMRIGQILWAILLGCVGGLAARAVFVAHSANNGRPQGPPSADHAPRDG